MTAAMDLFQKKGYHSTTMRQICDASKVNRGSFYDYFGSKGDILVYIFRSMMYRSDNLKERFPETHISKFKDLEPFVRHIVNVSWELNRAVIRLLFRETDALDRDSLKMVLETESGYTAWIADNFRRGLKLQTVTPEIEMLANSTSFFCSFFPLRRWNMRHLDKEKLLACVVDMIMVKLKKLKIETKRRQKQSLVNCA